jgi:hypothetical protein
MSSNDALYTRLFVKLREFHSDQHLRRIANWAWIVVGLIQSHSVHLSEIAQHIPSEAEAPGRIAQVRRWLANQFIQVADFYRPLITQAIQTWQGKNVFLILDGCSVNHERLQFFRLSLSHCYRALPLAWLVVASAGLIQVEACAALFEQVVRILPVVASVTFLADRGFRDTDWAEKCLELNWNYLIRVANNTYVVLDDGRQLSIQQFAAHVPRGRCRYFTQVRLTQAKEFPCNLMITWTTPRKPGEKAELCAVITNLRPCHLHLKWYLKRMHVEESFRDDKSGSFDLEATKLRDPERLNHLLLAVAVATLWIYEIGEQVLHNGERSEIDPGYQRQLSVFQIGRRKLQRAFNCGKTLLFNLQLRPFRLEPVHKKW